MDSTRRDDDGRRMDQMMISVWSRKTKPFLCLSVCLSVCRATLGAGERSAGRQQHAPAMNEYYALFKK